MYCIPVVHESLWDVLDEGDAQLHVGAEVEKVEPGELAGQTDYEAGGQEEHDQDENGQADTGHALTAALQQ